MVPDAGVTDEVSVVTAGVIVGGEYKTVCVVITGADDGVGVILSACWSADWAACVAIDCSQEGPLEILVFDRLGGRSVGVVPGVIDDVTPDVVAVVVIGLGPTEEVVGALDPVASNG